MTTTYKINEYPDGAREIFWSFYPLIIALICISANKEDTLWITISIRYFNCYLVHSYDALNCVTVNFTVHVSQEHTLNLQQLLQLSFVNLLWFAVEPTCIYINLQKPSLNMLPISLIIDKTIGELCQT